MYIYNDSAAGQGTTVYILDTMCIYISGFNAGHGTHVTGIIGGRLSGVPSAECQNIETPGLPVGKDM